MANKLFYLFIFLFIFIIVLSISSTNCELRFVFEMLRHGARGPIFIENNIDILGEKWSTNGELTPTGMRQHYLLGYRNRQRYKDFISESFDPKEIYVVSTDFNRTIASAQSQLLGLFPPGTGSKLTAGQIQRGIPPVSDFDYTAEVNRLGDSTLPNTMSVFPVHLFDYSNKLHFLFEENICPNAGKITENRKNNTNILNFINNFNKNYGQQFSQILNITTQVLDYDQIHMISDTFICDYIEGRELSLLTNAGINLDEFYKIAIEHLNQDVLDINSGDLTSGIVSMSQTMLEIYEWMRKRISNDIEGKGYDGYSSPKLVMYSAHDRNIASLETYLQAVFNITDRFYPGFATSVLFELYRPDYINITDPSLQQDYYLTVTLNNNLLLNITFPEFQFNVLSKSYNTDQIGKFCGWPDPDPTPIPTPIDNGVNYFMVSSLLFALVALIELGYIIYQRKSLMPRRNNEINNYNKI